MKKYLVGGAVRDELMGIPHQERDWVVVGATAQEMLAQGYRLVGKDFPVFLHPKTKEEYALARTERKVGRGYTGFTFNASPEVTLVEDLKRRDLTINAIAQDRDTGELFDPFHGQKDIENKILRHVSEAFVEDPVRILRVARFAARYADRGFTVAPDTLELMKQMVKSGEVDALVPERVWKEWERALMEKRPDAFFRVLEECGAMKVLFPELSGLSFQLAGTDDPQVRFAVLFINVEVDAVRQVCERYRVPSDYRDLALLVARHREDYLRVKPLNPRDQIVDALQPMAPSVVEQYLRRALEENPEGKLNISSARQFLNPEQIINLLQSTDAFRREERFKKMLKAYKIYMPERASDWLNKYFEAAKNIDIKSLVDKNLSGEEMAKQIKLARINAIEQLSRNESEGE